MNNNKKNENTKSNEMTEKETKTNNNQEISLKDMDEYSGGKKNNFVPSPKIPV